MKSLFQKLSAQDLAIDLGTANTLIYKKGNSEIILDEPSVVAIHRPLFHQRRSNQNLADSIVAVGRDAKQMLGRTPADIEAIRPLKDGVIADFEVTEIMLKHFIGKVQPRRMFMRPRIVISVPCKSTQVERRAIRDASLSAGAREVYLVDEPMAVAIGMNLPVEQPIGSMVVDIGGGTTEIGLISMSGLVWSSTLRSAGDLFDNKIKNYIENAYEIEIGLSTAEKIKTNIGTAWVDTEERSMNVKGCNRRGYMRSITIRSSEVYYVLTDSIGEIINGVQHALNESPPELAVDVLERGILLAGGGALLRDIDKRFNADLNIPAVIAEEPLTCVARGCGKALDLTNLLHQLSS